MARMIFEAARTIEATPAIAWDILADYRDGHPRILPPEFRDYAVERGGTGAGTIITFVVRAAGVTRRFRPEVTAPEPGRVLLETDTITGDTTTFTITPVDGGRRAAVRFTTEMAVRDGPLGAVERAATWMVLAPIYRRELANLDTLARTWTLSGSVEHASAG